jgi:putative acetyltransferase
MAELESIARARDVASLVLQTGHLQVAAIALYERIGYSAIAAFAKYTAVPHAVCLEKVL